LSPPDVLFFSSHIGKNDARGINSTLNAEFLNVLFPIEREAQKPKYGFWDPFQNFHPTFKRRRIDFVQLIEVAKNDGVLG
jgi:hypothetical protein